MQQSFEPIPEILVPQFQDLEARIEKLISETSPEEVAAFILIMNNLFNFPKSGTKNYDLASFPNIKQYMQKIESKSDLLDPESSSG
jgi:hypothetical protein